MKRTISMTCVLMMILMIAAGFAYGVKPDKPPKPDDDPPETSEELPWGVDRIDADEVWDSNHDMVIDNGANTGQGIKIAVLDTAGPATQHEDFTIVGGAYYVGNDLDDHGHGTYIAGILAALDNDLGFIGVAPGAELYAVKWREKLSFLPDLSGGGSLEDPASYSYPDLYAAMEWCINPENGIQVINMSFGMWTPKLENGVPVVLPNGEFDKGKPLHDPAFYNLIVDAHAAGIIMVAAAGNDNGRTIEICDSPSTSGGCVVDEAEDYMFPASYSEVIAVSATRSVRGRDYFTSFSNRGPAVELAAPGDSIETTTNTEDKYGLIGGTSAACPHVAAAAALVLKQLEATAPSSGLPDQVKFILTDTAEWIRKLEPDQQGSGMVDAQAAVSLVSGAPPRHTLSPRGKLSVTWGKLKTR